MKRIHGAMAMALGLTLALTACASSTQGGGMQKSTLDKILESKKVRVAILPDNPGWSVLGTDNQYHGVDADVARLLGEALGVEVEFQNTDGAGRVPMIQSGKADVVISCLTATDKRAALVGFTDPYAASGILGLCPAGNVYQSWDDLKGKKICVTRGSTNDVFATEQYPDSEIVRFDAIADAFTALKTGKVDVLLEEDTTVNDLAAKNHDVAVMPVSQQKSSYISMAIPKGDVAWMDYLNNFIRNALYGGKIQDAYRKAFGSEMPKLLAY